jgi:ribosome-binding protein aMBF1 (putative translation factor)
MADRWRCKQTQRPPGIRCTLPCVRGHERKLYRYSFPIVGRKRTTDEQRREGERLAHRLRHARLDLGQDQVELARTTGLAVDTIRALEGNRTASPSFFTVARLARDLGLDLDELARDAMST